MDNSTIAHEIGLDWFAATVPDRTVDVIGLVSALQGQLQQTIGGDSHVDVESCSAVYGYGYTGACRFVHGGDVIGKVMHSASRSPFVLSTGASAGAVEAALRHLGYDYRATRKDARVDFDDPCAFGVLYRLLSAGAQGKGLKTQLVGDWDVPGSPLGRTYYWGSAASRVRGRLYEHAKCHGEGLVTARLEVVVRGVDPDGKVRLARCSVHDLLRSDGVAAVALASFGVDLGSGPGLVAVPRSSTSLEAKTVHMVRSYGPHLKNLLARMGGDPAALVEYLLAVDESVRCSREALAAINAQVMVESFPGAP